MAIQTNLPHPAHRFIKRHKVEAMTSLSTSEIYRRIEAGTFPAQVKLGTKAVAWLEHEINDWIRQKVDQARTGREV